MRLTTNGKAGFAKQPLPVLRGIFVVHRKEAEAALATDVRRFFLAFLAPGKIGLQGHPNPIMQDEEAMRCQEPPDLGQHWLRVIEDVEDGRHGHEVYSTIAMRQGVRRDIVYSQRWARAWRGQLLPVGDHGWRHVIAEERGLWITLPEIT